MMQQTTFSKLNTLMAWLTFAIAAVVYGLTVEPTCRFRLFAQRMAANHEVGTGCGSET